MPSADAGATPSVPPPTQSRDPTTSILAKIRAGDTKVKTGAELKQQSQQLDTLFLKRRSVPEKFLIQEELGYMRRQLMGDRRAINITYPVNAPYAFVHIRFDGEAGELEYLTLEPSISAEDLAAIGQIRTKMEAIMSQEELPPGVGTSFERAPELREYLEQRFLTVLDLYDITVPERRRPIYLYFLERDFLGLGRTDAILRDPFLEDVSCLGHGIPLYVYHRVFGSLKTNIRYENEIDLNKYIFRLAQISGKHISIYQPILDATLRDGSRINLTLGTEVTRKGSTFSIRKFSQDPVSPIDLLRFGSVSPEELSYFWTLIENHRSLLISGGTASGKTTLLNAISMFIRPEDKIVSIEDTPEIHIDHQNWIQSVARTGYGMASGVGGVSGISGVSNQGRGSAGTVTLYDLLVAALRQRPEYVIVGEVRGSEAFTLFQAISVGHASMSTIHAGSIGELLHRVENEPMNIPRVLFQALDTVCFPAQVVVGRNRVRRLTGVTEILEVDPTTNELLTNDVYRWDPASDQFLFLGRSFALEKIARATGKDSDVFVAEMKRKVEYLKLMDRLSVTYFKEVARAIAAYYTDPEVALRDLRERSSKL